ncbi:hypothetical protein AAW14_07460 [Streptomyces hygroscopicus]|nr:hypothetical protein [Streptomyces hygroscopicus]
MADLVGQFGLRQPVIPGDLRGIGLDRFRDNDLVQTEPVRTDRPGAQELEHEPRLTPDAQLLRQLSRGGLLIRLGNAHRASEHPVEVPREEKHIVRTAVHEDPPVGITAHDRSYAMQPPMPNRIAPVHHAQHVVVLVDALNQFAHRPHDDRED